MKPFLLAILLVASWVIATKGYCDFQVYYSVSQLAGTGEFHRIYGVPNDVGGFFYSPIAFVLFAPLRLLPIEWSHKIWIALNTVAFLVFWRYLAKLFPALSFRFWPWFLVWIVSIKPIHASFQCHNMQLMYAALFCACYYATTTHSRAKRFWGGFFTAVAAVMKLYPLFLVAYYFVKAPAETKRGAVAGVLAGISIPILFYGPVTGPDLFLLFAKSLSHFHDYAPLTTDAVTLSLPSLIATWLSPSLGMATAVKIITVAGATVSALFFGMAWRSRNGWGTEAGVAEWALALAVMSLVNSTTRPDYFIYFVPGFAVLILACLRDRKSWAWAGLLSSVALVSFISEWSLGSRELNHALELKRIPVLGMLALCATLAAVVATSGFTRRNEQAIG